MGQDELDWQDDLHWASGVKRFALRMPENEFHEFHDFHVKNYSALFPCCTAGSADVRLSFCSICSSSRHVSRFLCCSLRVFPLRLCVSALKTFLNGNKLERLFCVRSVMVEIRKDRKDLWSIIVLILFILLILSHKREGEDAFIPILSNIWERGRSPSNILGCLVQGCRSLLQVANRTAKGWSSLRLRVSVFQRFSDDSDLYGSVRYGCQVLLYVLRHLRNGGSGKVYWIFYWYVVYLVIVHDQIDEDDDKTQGWYRNVAFTSAYVNA